MLIFFIFLVGLLGNASILVLYHIIGAEIYLVAFFVTLKNMCVEI